MEWTGQPIKRKHNIKDSVAGKVMWKWQSEMYCPITTVYQKVIDSTAEIETKQILFTKYGT